MSMGPSEQPEPILSRWNRLQYKAEKAVESYFKDPLYHTFWIGLAAVMVGLFFGMSFSWELYVILGGLLAAELYKYFMKKGAPEEIKKE